MKSNYKRLGAYIEPVNQLNDGMEVNELLGISNQKFFQNSHTNTIGIDLSTYRIVRTGQFAYNRATTRNGDKISIALRQGEDCIVSPSYRIFKSKDENVLNSEYLMMWFRRPEFDRYARFKSHGSAHEFFEWEEMCNVTLPIPHIDKQRKIVKEYNTIQSRINLNQQMIQKLEETAQAIYKQWFVEFEFPDENGKPYKSNGGKMVWNEELGKEIPLGWEVGNFKHDLSFKTGKLDSNAAIGDGKYPFFTCSEEVFKVNSFSFDQEAILLGGNNATGKFPLKYFKGKFDAYQRTYVINTNNNQISNKQIYFRIKGLLDEMRESSVGTTTKFLTMQIFNVIPILVPVYEIAITFEKHIQKIFTVKDLYLNENQKLEELKELLLSKLVTVEGKI